MPRLVLVNMERLLSRQLSRRTTGSRTTKSWKLGQEYYFGKGRSWGDQQLNILARFLNGLLPFSDEINERGSREVVTVFPSSTSSENAWYVATRVRGSFLLPQPITSSRVTLNQSDPDPRIIRLFLMSTGSTTQSS